MKWIISMEKFEQVVRVSKRKLYRLFGTILLLIGLTFTVFSFKDSIKSKLLRYEIDKERMELLQGAFDTGIDTDTDETIWKSITTKHEPVTNRQENTNEYAPVGAFIIPSIEQAMSVMDGIGGNNMFRGVSEQYLDQEMGIGNYVLSSHRMYDGTLFGRLHEVNIGDDVYLTDYETVYKYEVIESDNEVETTQTHLLQDTSESYLTFYGCTPDGTMRVVKRAKLVGYSLIKDLGSKDRERINISENKRF